MIRVRIRDYGMKSGAWEPETDPLFSGPPALDTKHFCLKWRGKCLVNKFQSEIIHDPFLDPLCWRGVVWMFCCRWSGVWPANTENHWSRATCLWLSFELYKRKWSPLNRVFLHAYFFFTSDGFSSHFFSKSFDDIQSSSIKNSIILFKTSLVRRQLQFLGLLCVWQKTERSSQWFCLSVKLLTLLHFLHTLLPFPAVNKHPNSTSGSRRCTRPTRLQCLPEGLFFFFPRLLSCTPSPDPIITSDCNRHLCSQSSFYFLADKENCFAADTFYAMRSVCRVIGAGRRPSSPRSFTQHLNHS